MLYLTFHHVSAIPAIVCYDTKEKWDSDVEDPAKKIKTPKKVHFGHLMIFMFFLSFITDSIFFYSRFRPKSLLAKRDPCLLIVVERPN